MFKIFESLWVECTHFSHKSILIKISNNPNKQFCSQFLDEIALFIGKASTKIKSISLTRHYNNNYLDTKQKLKLDNIFLPSDLQLMSSRTHPGTRTIAAVYYILLILIMSQEGKLLCIRLSNQKQSSNTISVH